MWLATRSSEVMPAVCPINSKLLTAFPAQALETLKKGEILNRAAGRPREMFRIVLLGDWQDLLV